MATNILSAIMSSAAQAQSASRPSGGRGGAGAEKEDLNLKPILNQMQKLAADRNYTALEALSPQAKELGIDKTLQAMITSSKTPTPEQQASQNIGMGLLGLIGKGLGIGGDQGTVQQAQPAPQPTFDTGGLPISTGEPDIGEAAPTTPPGRSIGPKLQHTGSTLDSEGNLKHTFKVNRKEADFESYLSKLRISDEQKESIRQQHYLAEATGIQDQIATRQLKKDKAGDLFMIYGFKDPNVSPRVIPVTKNGEAFNVGAGGIYGTLSNEQKSALSRAVNEGRIDYNRINSRTAPILADLEIKNPGRTDFAQMSEEILQGRREAGQRAGVRAATLSAANRLYSDVTPKLLELRQKAAAKQVLPGENIKTFNALDQWAQEQVSDPDVAEYRGRVLLLSEALQRTFASGQGGEWAFKLAKDLIDPSLGPEAFARRLEAHGEDLKLMTESYRSFGRNEPDFDSALQKMRELRRGGGKTTQPQIAPAGMKAKLSDGAIVTSDGKGGWQ